MEITIKTTLDLLTSQSVTVKTRRTAELEGKEITLGEIHAKAYCNSKKGRAEVTAEVSEPYRSAIFTLWGEEPTVDDEEVVV